MCTSPLLSLLPSLPQATYCRGLKGIRLIPLPPFHFTTAPYWHISFLWVLGLCLSKRKQQLVLSQDFFFTHHHYHHDFLERGGIKTQNKTVPLPRKQLQTTLQWSFVSVSATYTPSIMFPFCFRLFPFSDMQTLFVSLFGEIVGGTDWKETRGGNSQVRPLLSPVSLSAAMKDTVRTPLPHLPPTH